MLSTAAVRSVLAGLRAGLAQTEVAHRHGVSQALVSRIASGEGRPDVPRNGLVPSRRVKLPDADVAAIRAAVAGGESWASVAQRFGVSPGRVGRIVSGGAREVDDFVTG